MRPFGSSSPVYSPSWSEVVPRWCWEKKACWLSRHHAILITSPSHSNPPVTKPQPIQPQRNSERVFACRCFDESLKGGYCCCSVLIVSEWHLIRLLFYSLHLWLVIRWGLQEQMWARKKLHCCFIWDSSFILCGHHFDCSGLSSTMAHNHWECPCEDNWRCRLLNMQ